MSEITGQYVGLNLGPIFVGLGSHMPVNLGVPWDVDPPEPVIRGLRSQWGAAWRSSALVVAGSVSVNWRWTGRRLSDAALPWGGRANGCVGAFTLVWGASPRALAARAFRWSEKMHSRREATRGSWSSMGRQRQYCEFAWGGLPQQRLSLAVPWYLGVPARQGSGAAWGFGPFRRMPGRMLGWFSPSLGRRSNVLPWRGASAIPWIVRPPVDLPEPPEPSPFPPGDHVALNLGCPVIGMGGSAPLNLGVTACYVVRPQKGTYIVLNTISVVRLPDRTPIEVESVSISGSAGAWGYDVDMALADPAHLALLKPAPSGRREVEISVNGYVWTAVIENYSHRREFVRSGVSVTGRSRTALLAAPYAPTRALVSQSVRSMAQLAADELADTGYTIDWNTVDWLVPAGAWYYDGMTVLDAVSALAEAGGAVVQSDPGSKGLRVLPRYPVSPWDWPDTSPDHVVQDDIVITESGQVRSAPVYNAVVVTGELAGNGVTARVVREGEAGDLYAPQASSPLITVAAAARERARNILADRGEQDDIDLTLPLFPMPVAAGATGRVLPLELVEVRGATGTWHGQCTAIRIDARVSGNAVTVEQTITLERHYTDAN